MTDKELVPIKLDEIEKIRDLTGESTIAMEGMNIPWLNFNGQADGGKYSKSTDERDANRKIIKEEIGDTMEGVIVRIRKALKTGIESKRNLYTREFDGFNEVIDVYESGSRDVEYSGTYQELKANYPELRLTNVVYVYYEGQLWKLTVSSGSLSPLWDYLKQFKGDTVLRYITVFGSKDEVSQKTSLAFKQMTFEKGEPTPDWKKIWGALQKFNSTLSSTAVKKAKMLPQPEESVPTIQVEDEINVEDIPL